MRAKEKIARRRAGRSRIAWDRPARARSTFGAGSPSASAASTTASDDARPGRRRGGRGDPPEQVVGARVAVAVDPVAEAGHRPAGARAAPGAPRTAIGRPGAPRAVASTAAPRLRAGRRRARRGPRARPGRGRPRPRPRRGRRASRPRARGRPGGRGAASSAARWAGAWRARSVDERGPRAARRAAIGRRLRPLGQRVEGAGEDPAPHGRDRLRTRSPPPASLRRARATTDRDRVDGRRSPTGSASRSGAHDGGRSRLELPRRAGSAVPEQAGDLLERAEPRELHGVVAAVEQPRRRVERASAPVSTTTSSAPERSRRGARGREPLDLRRVEQRPARPLSRWRASMPAADVGVDGLAA